jgi:hypothetical protein
MPRDTGVEINYRPAHGDHRTLPGRCGVYRPHNDHQFVIVGRPAAVWPA